MSLSNIYQNILYCAQPGMKLTGYALGNAGQMNRVGLGKSNITSKKTPAAYASRYAALLSVVLSLSQCQLK